MVKRKANTLYYVKLALLTAILVVMSVTPLGYIPIPPIKATTTQIPVIVGGILLGPGAGMFLGAVFGIISVIRATLMPLATSFVFSPFLPVPGTEEGSVLALIVALVPRILAGLLPALLFRLLKSKNIKDRFACIPCAAVGALTNTLLVLGFIYLFFGVEYAAVLGKSYDLLLGLLVSVVLTNGLAELVISVLVVTAICIPMLRMERKGNT